jgi:acyl dehydratase
MITFDDLIVGQKFPFPARRVSEAEIISFAREFDPQSFHVDRDKARQSPFGGVIASGWHTCSMMMRMLCDAWLLDSSCAGSPGIDALKWSHPVRPDDTLSGHAEILSVKPSSSKPDRGIAQVLLVLKNHHDQTVLEMRAHIIFLKRLPA